MTETENPNLIAFLELLMLCASMRYVAIGYARFVSKRYALKQFKVKIFANRKPMNSSSLAVLKIVFLRLALSIRETVQNGVSQECLEFVCVVLRDNEE